MQGQSAGAECRGRGKSRLKDQASKVRNLLPGPGSGCRIRVRGRGQESGSGVVRSRESKVMVIPRVGV